MTIYRFILWFRENREVIAGAGSMPIWNENPSAWYSSTEDRDRGHAEMSARIDLSNPNYRVTFEQKDI